jgi:hypothetical protein
VSQAEADEYREKVRAQLDDELVLHDKTKCQYCRVGAACPDLHYARLAADIVARRLERDPRGPAGTSADDADRQRRAVRDALERLAARQARPNGARPRNQRSWPEAQNDLHSTL